MLEMGEDDINGPPKKKLKQVQLVFTPKSVKRRLSDTSTEDVQTVKQSCSDDDIKKNKENVLTNSQENLNEAKTETQGDSIIELSLDESCSNLNNSNDNKTADVLNTDTPECEPVKKLTPKQKMSLATKLEREQRRKEKEEEKLRKKLEKEAKELEKKLKEEEIQKKKLEKEKKRQEELRIKDAEKKAKEEEKKKKEEAKKLKDEEKRKKEEAKEEEKRKKEEAKILEEKKEIQAKIAFCNFFMKKDKKDSLKEEVKTEPKFMPFPVKSDMKLAILNRCTLKNEEKQKMDNTLFKDLPKNELYINEIKTGLRTPLKSEPTWPIDDELHDCIIIESVKDETAAEESESLNLKPKKRRAKLYKFHDNRRPPYWGTWRKKSKIITPKKPFGLDKEYFDYEVDSDSEWEDEGEGEDLEKEGEDSEKEQSDDEDVGENGYLLDNTFVPHGYLSDEEGDEDEDIADATDAGNDLKLKVLKEQFDEELKSKTERLKPRLLGCVWIRNDITEVSKGSLYETLINYRMVWDENNGPIDLSGPSVCDESPNRTGKPNKSFTPSVLEKLAKFVHGNSRPFYQLCADFITQTTSEDSSIVLSKRAVCLKIKEISSKNNEKKIWVVNDDLCKQYGLSNVLETPTVPPPVPITPPAPKDNILTKFLKKPNQPIKKRVQLTTLSGPTPKEPPVVDTPPPVKKRATLITLTPTTSAPQTVHVDTPRPFNSLKK